MKSAEFAATLAGALGAGGNSRAGAERLKEIGEPAPCICSIGGMCDTLCAVRLNKMNERPIDENKVRLRTVEFTADQLILKKVIDARLPDVCADAETGIALLSYCLSELIMRTARPGLLPEAVATAVRVLQYNCGVAEPVTEPKPDHWEKYYADRIADPKELPVGAIITNLGSGNAYVVIGHDGNGWPIAVRQITVTNPAEWDRYYLPEEKK